ncbi:MAG: T9SS type A sorting domain-containing protein, partial [Bacteroidota bacterium]
FVGFAYGDVNSVGRSSASLEVEDVQLEAGQTHTMVISGAELAGFQGTLELAAGLELVDISYAGEGGLNLNGAAEGVVAMLFRGAATVSVEVRATEAGQLSDLVSLTSSITLAEGVNLNGTGGALDLAFVPSIAPAAPQNVLYQNVPNPAVNGTLVRFDLTNGGPATLTLRDASGRIVRVYSLDAVVGPNQVDISELNTRGVFSYTLVAGDFVATKKMVVVRK